jgi:hypothetical protein
MKLPSMITTHCETRKGQQPRTTVQVLSGNAKRNSPEVPKLVLTLFLALLIQGQAATQELAIRGTWPGHPRGHFRALAIHDGLGYAALGSDGMAVVDVLAPDGFRWLGTLGTDGVANDVAVSGQLAYVAEGWLSDAGYRARLDVIDVTEPARPKRVGRLETPGRASAVALGGNFAYLTGFSLNPQSSWVGFMVVDVRDPNHPRSAGTYDTGPDTIPGSLAVSGDVAYVGVFHNSSDRHWIDLVDVSDPDQPRRRGRLPHEGGSAAQGMVLQGDLLFLAAGGLQVINVADPENPRHVGSYSTDGEGRGLTVIGTIAYAVRSRWSEAGAWRTEIEVFDVGDPAMPQLINSHEIGGSSARLLAVHGSVAIVDDYYGGRDVQLIDLQDPAKPQLQRYHTAGAVLDVAVAGDFAYLADLQGGLQIIDIRDPANPRWVAQVPELCVGVAVFGSFAYMANDNLGNGLKVIDISEPAVPKVAGVYGEGGYISRVSVFDGHALVLGASQIRAYWQFVDVSDSANPRKLGRDFEHLWDAVVASKHIAYGAGSWLDEETSSLRNGLFAIDITDPTNPRLIGSYETDTPPRRVAVAGDLAIVATPGFLRVVDIREPAIPRPLGQIAIQGEVRHVTISDHFAYVAREHDGLEVIDLANPTHPRQVGGSKSFAAFSTYVHGGKIYVAGGPDGLVILDTFTSLQLDLDPTVSSDQLGLKLTGPPGQRVRVQHSNNLLDWVDWQTVTLGESPGVLIDDSASASQRFYRTKAETVVP